MGAIEVSQGCLSVPKQCFGRDVRAGVEESVQRPGSKQPTEDLAPY